MRRRINLFFTASSSSFRRPGKFNPRNSIANNQTRNRLSCAHQTKSAALGDFPARSGRTWLPHGALQFISSISYRELNPTLPQVISPPAHQGAAAESLGPIVCTVCVCRLFKCSKTCERTRNMVPTNRPVSFSLLGMVVGVALVPTAILATFFLISASYDATTRSDVSDKTARGEWRC